MIGLDKFKETRELLNNLAPEVKNSKSVEDAISLLEISEKAFNLISPKNFQKPSIPVIDGKGNIWSPFSTNVSSLFEYTLGDQVFDVFNFSKAMSVALKEFCPDKVLLLGPGNSLGGVIGQILIKNKWNGIISKKYFSKQQEKDPFLISLGLEDQRNLI